MKFLYSYFFPQTGESVVALQDRYGVYLGEAKLHPDDVLYGSEYAGCRLAEQRAWLKYYKKKLSRLKIRRDTIKSLEQEIISNCYYKESPPPTAKQINHRIDCAYKSYDLQIKQIEQEIDILNQTIKNGINIRDKIIERTKKDNK